VGCSTAPLLHFKEQYAVSNDNVIKLIQPGTFDDQLTEVLRRKLQNQGSTCMVVRVGTLFSSALPNEVDIDGVMRLRASILDFIN
jgi:hypothetical protein